MPSSGKTAAEPYPSFDAPWPFLFQPWTPEKGDGSEQNSNLPKNSIYLQQK